MPEEFTTEKAKEAFKHGSKKFQEWWAYRHPKLCKCGKKIKEYKFYINDIAVCEECFFEVTKDWVFK